MTSIFADYDTGGFFDEVFEPEGRVRPHYGPLVERLARLDIDDLRRRERIRDQLFRTQGITFTVYGDDAGVERTFPMDLIPRVIPADEWEQIETGVAQRTTALNRFLDDLYVGEQSALHDGIVPRWLVETAEGFKRQAAGIAVPHGARCLVNGVDLIRDDTGAYLVLEDNARNPSGVSYVLENRAAMTRVLPVAFAAERVRPVDHYGPALLRALRTVAPAASGEDPVAVVLTPGMYNSAYFEHVFLARQMGVELVEGRDLIVDEHVVYMRTTHGLQRVDVIYRRIDDDFLDPVVFRSDSLLGVPGLLSAARAGNVTIANAVGNGVADDKAIYAFVPALIEYYLGETPILQNVPTYLLWNSDERAHVLDSLDEVVVKPVASAGGHGMLMGPESTAEERAQMAAEIQARPRDFIAQDVVRLSRHPTLVDDGIAGRHVDLRPFAISSDSVEVIPGGLTRVALRRDSLVVNSSRGGGSKDTWVLAAPPSQED
ncbi:MAG: circularly permuted type 2 ATP-grasp protein [Nitriliruptoraceae bacterium]